MENGTNIKDKLLKLKGKFVRWAKESPDYYTFIYDVYYNDETNVINLIIDLIYIDDVFGEYRFYNKIKIVQTENSIKNYILMNDLSINVISKDEYVLKIKEILKNIKNEYERK